MLVEKALSYVRSLEHPQGGLRAWEGSGQYFECTGYIIPTLVRFGEHELAERCARWLISCQNRSGSWYGMDGVERTFDTSAVIEGLRAVNISGAAEAVKRAEDWMRFMRQPNGVMKTAVKSPENRCYSMRASAIIGDDTPAQYWIDKLDSLMGERTHYIAYCLEGLWRVGQRMVVINWLKKARPMLKDGIMPYFWDGREEDNCSTAQFGLLRAWAGLDFETELSALNSKVGANGGILLSRMHNIRPLWAMKFYLDLLAEVMYPSDDLSAPEVVAIVVGIDHWKDITKPFVVSLRDHNPDLPIVLVDNASDKPYPQVGGVKNMRLKKRIGYNLALNAAIKANPGKDWYLLFNNDCVCNENFSRVLTLLNPRTVYGSGWNNNVTNVINKIDLQWSAWMAISKHAVKEIGLFDPLLTGAFEDFDYQLRAKKKGYRLDTLELPVIHLDSHTRHTETDYRERWASSREYYLKKWKLKTPPGSCGNKRAWIIGNAPSIANLDMGRLKHEVTFSSNRAYIAYEDWGWYPTYYIATDAGMVEQIASDINKLIESCKIKAFYLNGAGAKNIKRADNVHILKFEDEKDYWGFDPANFKYCGDVSAFALQLAYTLGYRDVYLAGVDLDWGANGKTGPDMDSDHFRTDYETEAVRMSPVFPHGHLSSWRKSIKEATAEPYSMRITVTTETSKLRQCLPYISFEAVT